MSEFCWQVKFNPRAWAIGVMWDGPYIMVCIGPLVWEYTDDNDF